MSRTLPTYAVEAAWSRELTGVFTLDTSTLNGPDVLAGFSGGTGTDFDDITSDVMHVRFSRGRQADLSAVQQGAATFRLKDSSGKYNPQNPSSPLAGSLVPLRPVRVRAWHDSNEYGLFRGFITRIEHNPKRDSQETTIEAADLFEWLNVLRPSVASTGPTTVGAVIGLLLDAVGWSDPSLRDLDTGHALTDFSADGVTSTALQIIGNLLTVDMGDFYIDGDGVAVYRDTDTRYGSGGLGVELPSTGVSDALPSTDIRLVRNSWTVTRQGGTPQTASDATSIADYGQRDGSPISSSYLANDSQAGALANFLVGLYKAPWPATFGVSLTNRDDEAITHQLAREIGDRVSFSESQGGTTTDATIEYIEHEIWQGGAFHRTHLLLRNLTTEGFTLDISELDGTHVLAY